MADRDGLIEQARAAVTADSQFMSLASAGAGGMRTLAVALSVLADAGLLRTPGEPERSGWHPFGQCPDRNACGLHASDGVDVHEPQRAVVHNDVRHLLDGLFGFVPLSVGERVADMVLAEVTAWRNGDQDSLRRNDSGRVDGSETAAELGE